MDGSTIATIGATVCAALGIVGGLYSHVSKLKESVLSSSIKLLGSKVDTHFQMQKDTLSRVDHNMDMTTQILEKHMEMLTAHDSRLAVVETEVHHLQESGRHLYADAIKQSR